MRRDTELVVREDSKAWAQMVYAEVLIPDTPNVYGDVWTKEAIVEAATAFLDTGFKVDVNHDNVDISDKVSLVESFIARQGDQLFIEGSWVVGLRITDNGLWQDVLDNKINGFSYEAIVEVYSDALLVMEDDGQRTGITEPNPVDGHTHTFFIVVDGDNRPISGGTDEVAGHWHTISSHTVTDEADGHTHRYNLVIGKDGK